MKMSRHLLLGIAVLVIIIGGLLLVGAYERLQGSVYDAFVSARTHIVQTGFEEERGYVKATYPYLFVDCKDRNAYDAYINTDSRTMTETQLKDALALEQECGMYFVRIDTLALDLFGRDVATIKDLAPLFPGTSMRAQAEDVADVWSSIYGLRKESLAISTRLVDIQKGYWEAELDKVRGTITPKERETRVGALNAEARQKLARQKEIVDTLATLRKKESALFSASFSNMKNPSSAPQAK